MHPTQRSRFSRLEPGCRTRSSRLWRDRGAQLRAATAWIKSRIRLPPCSGSGRLISLSTRFRPQRRYVAHGVLPVLVEERAGNQKPRRAARRRWRRRDPAWLGVRATRHARDGLPHTGQAAGAGWPAARRRALPLAPADDRARVRPNKVQPRHRPFPTTRTRGRPSRMAAHHGHAQSPQAPPPRPRNCLRRSGGLTDRRSRPGPHPASAPPRRRDQRTTYATASPQSSSAVTERPRRCRAREGACPLRERATLSGQGALVLTRLDRFPSRLKRRTLVLRTTTEILAAAHACWAPEGIPRRSADAARQERAPRPAA
jgi:hypothetical protein